MNSNNQIKYGALLSYFSIGINIVIGLLFTPWMINNIGKGDFGIYTLAMSVVNLFMIDFGLGSAVTRYIARYISEGFQDKANNILGLVYRLYIGIDVVLVIIFAVIFFLIPSLYGSLSAEELEKFKIIYIIVAFYSIFSFPFIPVNGVLSAHEIFVEVRILDIIIKVSSTIIMAIFLLLGMGLYMLVIFNAITGVLTIVLKLLIIRRKTPQGISWKYFNKRELIEIAGFSSWVTIIGLSQRCIFNLAPSILGAFSGSEAIAILGIAMTLEGYVFTFANAINGMFLPKVTRLVSSGEGNVEPLMIRIGRIQIYIIGLIVFGVLCFGKQFIIYWVGDAFIPSYYCTLLIIFPSILHLPQDIGIQTVYAKNEVKKLSMIYVLMALSNLILAFLLVPNFGTLGLCISIAVAYLLRTIGMDILFYKYLGIQVVVFLKKTYLLILPWMFLTVLFGMAMNYVSAFDNFWGLIIKVVLFVIIYSVVSFFCSMNMDEKKIFLNPLKKLIQK